MKRLSLLLLLIALVSAVNIATFSQDDDDGPPPLAENEVELILEAGLNDYDGVRDTSIYEEGELSNGAGQHIFSGRTQQNSLRRALIAFDLSQIPDGAEITLVNFRLTISRTPFNRANADVSLHRLLKDWGEGEVDTPGQEGRGSSAADGDATWTSNFLGSSRWDNMGGDFAEDPSATARAMGTGDFVIFQDDALITDIESWLENPDENFGWILVSDGQAKRYHSSNSEIEDEDLKPRLIVRYVPAEEE